MRNYIANSSDSSARIIALSMLVDGGIDQSELNVISEDALQKLNITREKFDQITHHLCNDMIQCLQGFQHGRLELDDKNLDGLLIEIQDERLRKHLLTLMSSIIAADQRLCENEAMLLHRALKSWQLDQNATDYLNSITTLDLQHEDNVPTYNGKVKPLRYTS